VAKFLVSKNTFACLAVFRRLSDKLKFGIILKMMWIHFFSPMLEEEEQGQLGE
jgi:hypothetical protein